ncbi:unnamed protein product [Camellia sinensis]
MSDSPEKIRFDFSKRKTSLPTAALFRVDDNSSPQLEELTNMIQDLSNRAYNLWISWVSDELSAILSRDLRQDDGLSTTSPLRGWEDTVVKQEQSDESQSEMKISLPAIPSLSSFLFRACEEIHRVGGHVLDKPILQKFALRLLEKVIGIFADFLSTAEAHDSQMSDKGVLQVLLDFRFVADSKFSIRRKQDVNQTKSVIRERVDSLVNRLSQRLAPIDWLTYELYLWENERQSYLRHAVLYGFLDVVSSRSSWKSYTNEEISRNIDIDDDSSFGVAAPFLKSFMQVGSRFGESTLKLGSMLTDGQVGRFKDKSTAAMSTFGDILPVQAAGLLSSFTASRSFSEMKLGEIPTNLETLLIGSRTLFKARGQDIFVFYTIGENLEQSKVLWVLMVSANRLIPVVGYILFCFSKFAVKLKDGKRLKGIDGDIK